MLNNINKSDIEVAQGTAKLLPQEELECFYKEASKETELLFEITTFDGLEDKGW